MSRILKHIFIYLLIIVNLGLICEIIILRHNSVTALKVQAAYFENFLKIYYEQLYLEIINNGTKLNRNIIVYDQNDNKLTIKELFHTGTILVLRFSELGCNLCIEKELELIKNNISRFDQIRIIILTNHNNIRKLNNFKLINDIKLNIYMTGKIDIPFENENKLYAFVTDSTLIVKHFFIPEKTLPNLSKNYYLGFLKKYNGQTN